MKKATIKKTNAVIRKAKAGGAPVSKGTRATTKVVAKPTKYFANDRKKK